MATTIAHIHVVLNLGKPGDRSVYDKLQYYPQGERARIVREALLQYLTGAAGEKSNEFRIKEVEGVTKIKETPKSLVMDTHKEEEAPQVSIQDTTEITPKTEEAVDKSEEARSRLKKMVY